MKWTPVSPKLTVVSNKAAPLETENLIFCWESISPTRIEGAFVPYSWYASNKEQVRPLAITGICEWQDKVLLGKRAATVYQYPDFWEFVPSGGVSQEGSGQKEVDYRRQVLLELEEECGYADPESITLVGLLEDEDQLVDMVFRVKISSPFTPSCKTGEVTAFQWVPKDALKAFLQTHGDNLVPATRFLARIATQ